MEALKSLFETFAGFGAIEKREVTPTDSFSGKGMHFTLEVYDFEGCANISFLSMKAFFGLMKMDSLICTPYSRDLPIYSVDGIYVPGKDTALIELYNTQIDAVDLSSMDAVKAKYSFLKEKQNKPYWYDSLHLSPTCTKTGGRADCKALLFEMTGAYASLFKDAKDCDPSIKSEKNGVFVEGLISNGGPAIDTIRSILGKDAAEELFRRFIFRVA